MPSRIKEALLESLYPRSRITLHVVGNLAEIFHQQKPQGYGVRATGAEVGAVNVGGTHIYLAVSPSRQTWRCYKIGSRRARRSFPRVENDPGVYYHELGHVLDEFSKSSRFQYAYHKDVCGIKKKIYKGRYRKFAHFNEYFLQDGEVGPREAYAEIFSRIALLVAYSSRYLQFIKVYPELNVIKLFPACSRLVAQDLMRQTRKRRGCILETWRGSLE